MKIFDRSCVKWELYKVNWVTNDDMSVLMLLSILLQCPVTVIERTDVSGLEPAGNAVEVESVIADSPSDDAFVGRSWGLVGLTFDACIASAWVSDEWEQMRANWQRSIIWFLQMAQLSTAISMTLLGDYLINMSTLTPIPQRYCIPLRRYHERVITNGNSNARTFFTSNLGFLVVAFFSCLVASTSIGADIVVTVRELFLLIWKVLLVICSGFV